MNIRVLGAHNCESVDSRFVCLLIDDILMLDAGALTSCLSWQEQLRLQAILLTHQHYDHIRDIPAIAINLFFHDASVSIFSSQNVYDALTTYMLNDQTYPNFFEFPVENPSVSFTAVVPYRQEHIEGYTVLPVPVNHGAIALGYQVTAPDGKVLFYTGDTGAGLSDCWEHISPQLLIIEVSAPNSYQDYATESEHLTPVMLAQELSSFQALKGYLPEIVVVHMNPQLEAEIAAEITELASQLNASITLAREGMQIRV
ncbi:MAG: MBL fold metallo-hydrolase [Dehalococcoidales bacterium]|nr:MAG: MBL fold metallo-hydrolase [Dehalococcoidales bacterium]